MEADLSTDFAKLNVFGSSPLLAHEFEFERPGLQTTAFSDSMTEKSLAKWPEMLQPANSIKDTTIARQQGTTTGPIFSQHADKTSSPTTRPRPGQFTPAPLTGSTSNIASSSTPFPLLRLPIELRLVIYDMLFAKMLGRITLPRRGCYPLPPLFRVCGQLRAEVWGSWKMNLALATKHNDAFVDFVLAQTLQEGDVSVLKYSQSGKHAKRMLKKARVHQADLAMLSYVAACVREGSTARSMILEHAEKVFDLHSKSQFVRVRSSYSDDSSNADS